MSYSKAVYEITKEKPHGLFESTLSTLNQIADSFKESLEFRNFLLNPVFSSQLKLDTLQKIFPELTNSKHEIILNLLRLLAKKQQFYLVEKIVKELNQIFNDQQQIEEVQIEAYPELNKTSQEKIKKFLKQKIKSKKIILQSEIKEEIKGGFILKTKDFIFDQSLRTKLSEFKQFLIEQN